MVGWGGNGRTVCWWVEGGARAQVGGCPSECGRPPGTPFPAARLQAGAQQAQRAAARLHPAHTSSRAQGVPPPSCRPAAPPLQAGQLALPCRRMQRSQAGQGRPSRTETCPRQVPVAVHALVSVPKGLQHCLGEGRRRPVDVRRVKGHRPVRQAVDAGKLQGAARQQRVHQLHS